VVSVNDNPRAHDGINDTGAEYGQRGERV